MDATTLALVGLAAFTIGFAKAGIAGVLGPLVTVLMLLALPAEQAIAVQLPMLMVGDTFTVGAMWRQWNLREALVLIPGAVLGVAVGTYILSVTPSDTLRRILALIILGFVAYAVWQFRRPDASYRPRPWHGWAAGGTTGVTSTLAHVGGPVVAMYLLPQRMTPLMYTATSALVFFFVNWIKVPGYVAAGLFDWDLQVDLAPTLVLIPVGVLIGRLLVTRINRELFERIVLILLGAGAVFLLVG